MSPPRRYYDRSPPPRAYPPRPHDVPFDYRNLPDPRDLRSAPDPRFSGGPIDSRDAYRQLPSIGYDRGRDYDRYPPADRDP